MATHLSRLHLRAIVLVLALLPGFIWLLLPYNHKWVLILRWHYNSVTGTLNPNDDWISEPSPFNIDMDDVAMIVKTGFSTQERLSAKLEAISDSENPNNLVLVGDYSTTPGSHFICKGIKVPVHNALAWMLDKENISLQLNVDRLHYFSDLTSAIDTGDRELALSIGKTHGWELDIMKHVSGLELTYQLLPNKNWYILLDDDTYILDASLRLLLGHLDSSVLHYMGNVVGGSYITKFAHGGSAIVISQAAMQLVFVHNAKFLSAFHKESLTAGWGDALVASTLMKSGVYLEERYTHHFNGESPKVTKIGPDRFCTPIVSFHGLDSEQMYVAGRRLKNMTEALSWIDIWESYEAPSFSRFLAKPFRNGWDHVGRLDQSTVTTNDVPTKEDCLKICSDNYNTCLAWTWETENHACHYSPWMIVGNSAEHKFTGINTQRAITLAKKCKPRESDVSKRNFN